MLPGMDDLTFVRGELQKIALKDLDALASDCGVPFGTLQKIKYGSTADPRFQTVKALADHFRSRAPA